MTRNIKISIIIGLIAVGLLGCITYQYKAIKNLKAEKEIYKSNTDALMSSMEHYVLDSGLQAGSVKTLQLSVQEYESKRAEDAAIINQLGVKVKQLESASKTQITVSAPIAAQIHDSIYISKDTVISHVQKIEMNNRYIGFKGVIENDSLHAEINIPVTLNQFVYYTYKHKFLWWKWGVGTVHQVITTDNPYVNINYTEYIKLTTK